LRANDGEKAPRESAFIAVSAFFASTSFFALGAEKITLPLERSVRTSVKPAASTARFSSGIFAFIGLTPRRNGRTAA
jgi:hypothetical protein